MLGKAFNEMLDILNNPVKKSLRAEFRRVQRAALVQYRDTGAVDDDLFVEHKQKLVEIAYLGFMRSLSIGAKTQLIRLKNVGLTNDEKRKFENRLKTYFREWALAQADQSAKAMAKTSKDVVDWLIQKYTEKDAGQQERNGIFEIIQAARKEALERSIWRSFVGGLAIVHGGANKGQFDAASETERVKGWEFVKVWITMRDDKVRDTHIPMHKQRIRKGELFKVPRNDGGFDMMRYPGDRNASIGNWINCRCSLDLEKVKTDG